MINKINWIYKNGDWWNSTWTLEIDWSWSGDLEREKYLILNAGTFASRELQIGERLFTPK